LHRQHEDLQAARQPLWHAGLVQRACAGSRHAAGRDVRTMSRWVAGAAVLGAAAVICYFMQATMPHYADLTGPIPARGTMDDTVRTRQFDLHVDKIVL